MTNFNQFKPNPNFLATHPLAFTILKNTKITKFKSFNKIYFHSNNLNNLQEIYNKFSENILSALPKPKGTNSEILKRQSIFKNEEFSCFENFNFEKFEAIFDGFLKNFNFADDGSEFFVVDFAEVGTCSLQPAEKVESGNSSKKGDKNAAAEIAENEPEKTEPAFNAAKNSYEAGVGVLKNANDMVDFYFDLAKKYTFIKYFINCFLKKDAELNQVLQDKLQEAGLSTRVIAQTQVEEIGQNIENCPILNATSSANLHDVHALHWNAGKYEVILMDGVGCLNKFR